MNLVYTPVPPFDVNGMAGRVRRDIKGRAIIIRDLEGSAFC